jgi:hypothetical protein
MKNKVVRKDKNEHDISKYGAKCVFTNKTGY